MFQGHSLVHGPGSLVESLAVHAINLATFAQTGRYEQDTIFGFPAIQVKFHAVHLCYGR